MLILNVCCLAGSYNPKYQAGIKEIRNRNDADIMIWSSHNRIFGKNNLITSRMTTQDSDAWYTMLSALKNYVEKNDKDLLKYHQILVEVSNNLINTLKVIFNTQIAGALTNAADKAEGISNYDASRLNIQKLNLPSIKQQLDALKKDKEKLNKLLQDIKPGFFTSSTSKEIREVLTTLARLLEATIDKVNIDLGKIR